MMVAQGYSPQQAKQALFKGLDESLPLELKEYAVKWWRTGQLMGEAIKAEMNKADNLEVFAWQWFAEIVQKTNRNPRNIERVLHKDIIPAIGAKKISDVTVGDVLAITDVIKARGSDQMALQTRNILKRLFGYAIARQKITFNPAAAVEAQFIATTKSREVALTPDEIGRLICAVYQSSIRRAHKLAIHLLILCMVRKSELIQAQWHEINFDKAEWQIPAERMKKDRIHTVPLSSQALEMFKELQFLACGSRYIFPSRNTLHKPISHNALNQTIRTLDLDIREFVIHDFRRTASTLLHEQGFNSDWVEKCLAHEQKGVRGVYNKAEYLNQRREMLQWWADFVDSHVDDLGRVITGRISTKK
jgi:integrase